MLERVFGEVRARGARPALLLRERRTCAAGRLVIDRERPAGVEAVGASMSLPLIAPPMRRDEGLLIDGSLLDNLPMEPMSSTGEGPVLAIDIKGGEDRPAAEAVDSSEAPVPERRHRTVSPRCLETMGAYRAAQQREHRRGRPPPRRPHDRGARLRGGAAGVPPDRSGPCSRPSQRARQRSRTRPTGSSTAMTRVRRCRAGAPSFASSRRPLRGPPARLYGLMSSWCPANTVLE